MANHNEDLQEDNEKYRHRVLVLLSLIGLWLALPATCVIVQRIIDSLTSFDIVSKSFALITKIITDSCLLGIYTLGLLALISIGSTALVAWRTIDKVNYTVKTKVPKAEAAINRVVKSATPILLKVLGKIPFINKFIHLDDNQIQDK